MIYKNNTAKKLERTIEENEQRKVVEENGVVRIIDKKQKRKSFWIRIPKSWWRENLKNLDPTERCLLISLALYASPDGFCYPSLRRLSSDLNISVNTARKYLRILEKKGFIKIIITKKGYWNKWTYKLVSSLIQALVSK